MTRLETARRIRAEAVDLEVECAKWSAAFDWSTETPEEWPELVARYDSKIHAYQRTIRELYRRADEVETTVEERPWP